MADSDKAITVRFDDETMREIEATAEEDYRKIAPHIRYLVALGLSAREQSRGIHRGETQIDMNALQELLR